MRGARRRSKREKNARPEEASRSAGLFGRPAWPKETDRMIPPLPQPDSEPAGWACVHLNRDLAGTGPATEALRNWLQARGLAESETQAEIVLATTEALTNAIRHGGGGASEFTVRLAWRWQDDELEIEVSEPGRFEPALAWSELPADPLSEGGRGGFLITRLMDAVEHRNAGGRHTLRMRRRLRADGT